MWWDRTDTQKTRLILRSAKQEQIAKSETRGLDKSCKVALKQFVRGGTGQTDTNNGTRSQERQARKECLYEKATFKRA
jgi:hypothetical protein